MQRRRNKKAVVSNMVRLVTYPILFCAGLLAWCCPCIAFGKNAAAVGDSQALCCLGLWCCPWFYPFLRCYMRSNIRKKKNIDVSAFSL